LLKIIKEKPGLRANSLSKIIKKPLGTIERWLKKLKSDNKIEYRGGSKTGGYFVR
jgi:ATP-dependent DNA helicase RecG